MTQKQPSRKPTARTTTFFYLSLNEDINAKELVEKSYQQDRREYDSEGRLVRQIHYHQDGHELELDTYTYSENGFLAEETRKTEGDDFTERLRHEPGEGGKVAVTYRYYADGSFDTTAYAYDEEGRTLEVRTTDSDGEEEWKETHSYPSAMEEHVIRTEWEELAGERIIKRSEHGLLDRFVTNGEGETLEHIQHTYNEAGKVTHTRMEEEGNVYEIEFSLDELGNPVKEVHTSEEEGFVQTVENEFDADGNILKQRQLVETTGRPDSRFARQYDYEWSEVSASEEQA